MNPYLTAAVDSEIDTLRRTTSGRACATFKAAAALGNLVGSGELDRADTERTLLAAALETGLPQREAMGQHPPWDPVGREDAAQRSRPLVRSLRPGDRAPRSGSDPDQPRAPIEEALAAAPEDGARLPVGPFRTGQRRRGSRRMVHPALRRPGRHLPRPRRTLGSGPGHSGRCEAAPLGLVRRRFLDPDRAPPPLPPLGSPRASGLRPRPLPGSGHDSEVAGPIRATR